MMRTTRSLAALAAPVALGVLLLGGCAAESPGAPESGGADDAEAAASAEPAGSDSTTPSDVVGEAVVEIGGREFGFVLERCMVMDGEALLEGPGSESGTDVPSFLGADVTQTGQDARGEVRIDIGATDAYESSDEMLAFGAPEGGDFSFVEAGSGYVVSGPAWDGNGTDLGIATMTFACG